MTDREKSEPYFVGFWKCDPPLEYFTGDFVIYAGKMYFCTETHGSSETDKPGMSDKWKKALY